MPRDSAGNYTLPAGNPVVGGQASSATVQNNTNNDIRDELTDSLSRSGKGGMLAPFLNADGTVLAPGITFTNEPATGWFRNAANDVRFAIAGVLRAFFNSTGVGWTSPVTDGAGAVGFTLDTVNALADATAKLASYKIAGAEKVYIDKAGSIQGSATLDGGALTAGANWSLGAAGVSYARKSAGLVVLNFTATAAAGAAFNSIINALPAGFRPRVEVYSAYGLLYRSATTAYYAASIGINTGGLVVMNYYDNGTEMAIPPVLAVGDIVRAVVTFDAV